MTFTFFNFNSFFDFVSTTILSLYFNRILKINKRGGREKTKNTGERSSFEGQIIQVDLLIFFDPFWFLLFSSEFN